QPQSLPPGESWSAGMKRSTIASTVAASPGLKKYQPSGLTGLGGSPAKGDHGTVPEIVAPSAATARIGRAATEAKRLRRLSARDVVFIIPPAPASRRMPRRSADLTVSLTPFNRFARRGGLPEPCPSILIFLGADPKSEFRADQLTV